MSIAVGLVGFGLSARVLHAPLIQSAGMRIVAVLTRQEAAVRAALPEAQVLSDLESLLALAALDLVVIATPNHLHCPQALAALERGKHVVIDKPMALSSAEADRLIATARARSLKLAVFQNRRWDSDFLTLRRLIDEERLGAVRSFEARWDRYRPVPTDRWRERAHAGGGVLWDLGSHLIDQALCLFARPEWLQAQVFAQRAGAQVDDGFEILMGRGPLRVRLGASSLAADHALRYRMHGLRASFRKHGLDVQEQQLRAGRSPDDPAFGIEPRSQWGWMVEGEPTAEQAVPAEGGQWREFYVRMRASLETNQDVPVSGAQGREVIALIEAARRSSEQGRRIDLDDCSRGSAP